jgi:uncharacterized protein YecT (DUF1311 family)
MRAPPVEPHESGMMGPKSMPDWRRAVLLELIAVFFALWPAIVMAEPPTAENISPQPGNSELRSDCKKVGTSVELVICADANLARWDGRMGRAYNSRLAGTKRDENTRQALIEAQHRWMSQRNMQCHQVELTAVKSCILEMTKSRVEALQKTDAAALQLPSADTDSLETASVQTASQAWDWCAGKEHASADLQIKGCTTVIKSGQEASDNLGIAFGNRGNGYQGIRNYRAAVADYDEAIKHNANDPIIFNNRGIAHGNQGKIDQAIADFSEAIRMDPKFAEAFAHRGLLRVKKGDAGGDDDIKTAEALKPALTDEIAREQADDVKPPAKNKGRTHSTITGVSGSAGTVVTSPFGQ